MAWQDGSGQGEATSRSAAQGDEAEETADNEENGALDFRVAKGPKAPTKAMVLAYELHHEDYREWCEQCVACKETCHQHHVFFLFRNGIEFTSIDVYIISVLVND